MNHVLLSVIVKLYFYNKLHTVFLSMIYHRCLLLYFVNYLLSFIPNSIACIFKRAWIFSVNVCSFTGDCWFMFKCWLRVGRTNWLSTGLSECPVGSVWLVSIRAHKLSNNRANSKGRCYITSGVLQMYC